MYGDSALARRDRAAWNLLWVADHLIGRERVDRLAAVARSRLRERIEADLRAGGRAALHPVERRGGLDPVTFQRQYVRPCRPVVLEGAARDWPCVADWTPEHLAERYGDEPVTFIRAAPDDVGDIDSPDFEPGAGETTLAEVVAAMARGDADAYARFIPLLRSRPELAGDLDRAWIGRMRPRGALGTFYMTFIGGPGSVTSLHNAIGSNLFVQVHGEKTWWLYPPTYNPVFDPPLKRAPFFFSKVDPEAPPELLRHVHGFKATLRAGDVLYNPPFYWHHIRNPTTSIGVGVRFYDLPSILRTSPTQALLTLLATNPPMWVGRRLRFDFTKVFTRMR